MRAALEALHVVARELAPFLPETSESLLTRLRAPAVGHRADWNVLHTGAPISTGAPLFRRLGRG